MPPWSWSTKVFGMALVIVLDVQIKQSWWESTSLSLIIIHNPYIY
jgi:hypothetical protein